MGYRLNRLDEPVSKAVSKPLLTEFGIHYRLESCVGYEKSILSFEDTLEPLIQKKLDRCAGQVFCH